MVETFLLVMWCLYLNTFLNPDDRIWPFLSVWLAAAITDTAGSAVRFRDGSLCKGCFLSYNRRCLYHHFPKTNPSFHQSSLLFLHWHPTTGRRFWFLAWSLCLTAAGMSVWQGLRAVLAALNGTVTVPWVLQTTRTYEHMLVSRGYLCIPHHDSTVAVFKESLILHINLKNCLKLFDLCRGSRIHDDTVCRLSEALTSFNPSPNWEIAWRAVVWECWGQVSAPDAYSDTREAIVG